jgi:hypothetical protein
VKLFPGSLCAIAGIVSTAKIPASATTAPPASLAVGPRDPRAGIEGLMMRSIFSGHFSTIGLDSRFPAPLSAGIYTPRNWVR